ncbi:MAG: beta-ketoacyl synthase N-terminal-like domain-containing protein, partial [Cyanobacteria bacterium P01_E01_bin.48]
MTQTADSAKPTLTSSQRILLALDEAAAKLEAAERAKTEPIAIIGMSCRFPGEANDPQSFWQLLQNGKDTVGSIPGDRWNVDEYYDPDPNTPGKIYTREGAFLSQVDRFDASFFGISPREALSMDPQQRLLLEVCWEALEHAGQAPSQLVGSRTGTFLGIGQNDYFARVQLNGGKPTEADVYATTGNGFCFASGRLSYILGLQGPNLAVDTACSSSLVAVHLAAQSLRAGECDLALIAGVQLILSPEITVGLSGMRALSPDGRCKTFDAAADGYGRGEGCGAIACKRLSDALRDSDTILATVRGSAVNHDGPSSGLTVPNGQAQQALLRQALQSAKVEPAQISYIEAHGTGTSLGDPIEIEALSAVLGEGRSPEQPFYVGSVKTNIGHLEAAAGIAGLIKVILALQHREIPPHLHFQTPSPHIRWDECPARVPTEPTLWEANGQPRLAGLSSFGISGTNAHLILEEAPSASKSTPSSKRPLHLLALSARSESALAQRARDLADVLAANPELDLADACWTSNAGRSHFAHRASLLASSSQQARKHLEAIATGEEIPEIVRGEVQSSRVPKIAFLFTGQGSQYADMGRELYDTQPVFRRTLDRCSECLAQELEHPLLAVLFGDKSSLLNETAYTQPALFAIEYALAQLWLSWGVKPSIVMGHSVGEYVAACLAGVFNLEDGLKLIAARARLMQALPSGGAMVALMAPESEVAEVIAAIADEAEQVAIAAINGPRSTVISGVAAAVESVVTALEARDVKAKRLTVSHAFHSPLMEPMLADFEQVARQVSYSQPRLGVVSNVTGQMASAEIATAEYWCRHVRQPVRFAAGMETLGQRGYDIFLEVGPKPTLLGMGRFCLPESEALWLPSLRPGQSDWQSALSSLSHLYSRGIAIEWAAVDAPYASQRLQLPTYPFQRQRFWIETASKNGARPTNVTFSANSTQHPLLGQKLLLAESAKIRYQSEVAGDAPAYLAHHCVYQTAILPATGYLEMALAAGKATLGSESLSLESISIQQPLVLSGEAPQTLQLVLTPQETDRNHAFQVFSLTPDEESGDRVWTLHAAGAVGASIPTDKPQLLDVDAAIASYAQAEDPASYYRVLRQRGMEFGSSFQAIAELYRDEGRALGRVRLPVELMSDAERYQFHPVLFDACLQVLGAALSDDEREACLPVAIERLHLFRRPGTSLWSQVSMQPLDASGGTLTAEIVLFDDAGQPVALLEGVTLRRVSRQTLQRILQPNADSWLYQIVWQPQPLAEQPSEHSSSRWLILADRDGLGEELANVLEARGDRCVLAFAGEEFARRDESSYSLNPTRPDDFQRLLQETSTDDLLPYRGAIHLWSSDGNTVDRALNLEVLQDSQRQGCASLLHLVQALNASASDVGSPRLWVVTRDAQTIPGDTRPVRAERASLWGLGRVVGMEHPELGCTCVDISSTEAEDLAVSAAALLTEIAAAETEPQVAYRNGDRYIARLERLQRAEAQTDKLQIPADTPYQLRISEFGILENLMLVPMKRQTPAPGEVEIQVRAVGLNFRDVLNALGMLKEFTAQMGLEEASEIPFGGECAGVVVAVGEGVDHLKVGDEVMAAQAVGCLASFVTVQAEFVISKPSSLSFAEAATVPTAFLTAYYGLVKKAQLASGERVLIHSA